MSIPTYSAGQIGFVICTKPSEDGTRTGVRQPAREFSHPELKYYNGEVHKAACAPRICPHGARAMRRASCSFVV